MNPRLSEAILRNDILAFKRLVQQDKRVLEQRSAISLDSTLHLASRLGHNELVAEIVKFRPDFVAAVNKRQETSLHAACHQGNFEVVKLLLETDPLAATKLNHENESAFLIACREGHLGVVKLMLNQSWLMEVEEDAAAYSTPLHVATLRGHNDIVEEILEMRPNFAQKTNKNGFSPLHCACSKGQLEITKLLLSSDLDLAMQYNNHGYTPLHLAVINGHLAILEAFVFSSPSSLQCLTKDGETVLHLAVKFNRYNVIKRLAQVPDFSHLLHQQDQDGNNKLHLAFSRGDHQHAKYILNSTVDIDCRNDKGQKALDILELAGIETKNKQLKQMSSTASDDRTMELSSVLPKPENLNSEEAQKVENSDSEVQTLEDPNPEEVQRLENSKDAIEERIRSLLQHRSHQKLRMITNRSRTLPTEMPLLSVEVDNLHTQNITSKSLRDVPEKKFVNHYESRRYSCKSVAKKSNDQPTTDVGMNQGVDAFNQVELGSSPPTQLHQHKSAIQTRRKEMSELHNHRNKQYEIHKEAVQNARNTIVLVAILIATVTFTVGLNPPGGFNQGGTGKGQAAVGRKMAFKIFVISNSIALFTSLCIVIILVSIIPFQRKKLMRLMMIAHKVMWIAVSFMATAFISATWVIMPHAHRTGCMLEVILAIGAGSMATVFIYLGIELARHWLRKSKWKRHKDRKTKIVAVCIEDESQPDKSITGAIQPQPVQFNNEGGTQSESSNSDVDSSKSFGYHTY
ncbi:hypothetical protein P3X46_011042 [Hevea brasiliensis]|uniref:PGG domain-containing protein n=1 Tax=Hevea brasiliensis TaxID=3981 RepID=A0ABQ9MID4_HEVBR|nr:ankyrin repeat-containing protein ITN1 isoform X2 [Hevea brasiliensis]KAJ9179232.1 hypothetical protein P3X46_011042 [Hevea brasiliensis]